jgi:hypothetical protein
MSRSAAAQVSEVPRETQHSFPAAEGDTEEAAEQLSAEPQTPAATVSSPPPEADTREAAYARMQALLAERNGLPPPQPLPAPASIPLQPLQGAWQAGG